MIRLDIYLSTHGFCDSRSSAKDAILEKRVTVNDTLITKASFQVTGEETISVLAKEHAFASRGGDKLYEALQYFNIDLTNQVVLDIGASTGGFSDVCLQSGAQFVYAVDIGKDQLIERLRLDERVQNMEGVNCRYLSKDMFHHRIDFVCMDVSFISIKLICTSLFTILEAPFTCVFLIKPQFEAGKEHIGKNGVVKDKKVHKRILEAYIHYFQEQGVCVKKILKSSTIGRSGNQEYLIHITSENKIRSFDIDSIVKG